MFEIIYWGSLGKNGLLTDVMKFLRNIYVVIYVNFLYFQAPVFKFTTEQSSKRDILSTHITSTSHHQSRQTVIFAPFTFQKTLCFQIITFLQRFLISLLFLLFLFILFKYQNICLVCLSVYCMSISDNLLPFFLLWYPNQTQA